MRPSRSMTKSSVRCSTWSRRSCTRGVPTPSGKPRPRADGAAIRAARTPRQEGRDAGDRGAARPEASVLRPGDITDALFDMPARLVPGAGLVVVYLIKDEAVIVLVVKPREP